MAPVKRRPRERSHRKMNFRRPSIPELVYRFLSLGYGEGKEKLSDATYKKCRSCRHQKRRGEVVNSLDFHGRNMANKRRDTRKNSKIHRVKRRHTARDQTLSSCIHSRSRGEGVKKMKKYIQKALDFGVESGYLIPKDAEYRVLRVSSDLMHDGNYMSKSRKSDRVVSQDWDDTPRQTPIRFEDYEVQDAKRRKNSRKRRKRSRSNSRRRKKRGRRRRSEVDEIVENDDYELDENGNNAENANRDDENERSNHSDGEKTTVKKTEDGSELSVDEDETDEEEKKRTEMQS